MHPSNEHFWQVVLSSGTKYPSLQLLQKIILLFLIIVVDPLHSKHSLLYKEPLHFLQPSKEHF